MNNAIGNTSGLQSYWSVQHRHPDGRRWFDVAHYLTREDAETSMAKALEAHPGEDLRVSHVRRS